MRSRSWLLRWCYATAMTVLQKALDSAIDKRENHKHQNVRLQVRLDDIERRRAAILHIEDVGRCVRNDLFDGLHGDERNEETSMGTRMRPRDDKEMTR